MQSMDQTNHYFKQCRLEWSSELKNKSKIYLDTKFWIHLFKEAKSENPEGRIFYDLVNSLVESGKCVFPLSEITFWEILKQEDDDSRSRSFELIDYLSQGFSIIQSDELIYLQARRFKEIKKGNTVENFEDLIWTKTMLLLVNPGLPIEFYDFLSKESLSLWHDKLLGPQFRPFTFKTDAEYLNEQKGLQENIFTNFEKLHLHEIKGSIDSKTELLNMIELNLGELIYQEFKTNSVVIDLPYFSIYPVLFAVMRWDQQNQFDKNDTMDFLHAACALPSCDYFFTEKQLGTLLKQKKLDSLFDCKIEYSPQKAIELLTKLL